MTEFNVDRECFSVAVDIRCNGVTLSQSEAMIEDLARRYAESLCLS